LFDLLYKYKICIYALFLLVLIRPIKVASDYFNKYKYLIVNCQLFIVNCQLKYSLLLCLSFFQYVKDLFNLQFIY